MQLCAYLIINWVLYVIYVHVYLAVTILGGKANEAVKENYKVLIVQYDLYE